MIPVKDLPTTTSDAVFAGWKEFSSGCSRRVYEHPDHPMAVLKIGWAEHNSKECDMWEEFSESAFSFSLTPILGRSECYYAILMKRMMVSTGGFGDGIRDSYYSQMPERRPALDGINLYFGDTYRDFHGGNWGYIPDDYGFYTPGSLVDYAGAT